jgi:hypothetical protein
MIPHAWAPLWQDLLMASSPMLLRAFVFRSLLIGCALVICTPARADSETKCRRDSGGHVICKKVEGKKVERQKPEKCTLTCKKDSGGNTVCRQTCR